MNYSVLETVDHWSSSLGSSDKARNLSKNLRTALKLYYFEGLGFKTREMKPSEFEQFCAELLLKKWVKSLPYSPEGSGVEEEDMSRHPLLIAAVPLETQLVDGGLQIFDQQFETAVLSGVTSSHTKRNYRAALGQYLKWIVSQVWWQELFPKQIPEILPARPRKAKVPQFRKQGSAYRLQENCLPLHIQEELAAYKDFRVTGGKNVRRQRLREVGTRKRNQLCLKLLPLKESSFEREKSSILFFLGWCVNINNMLLENLSFNCLTDIDLIEDYVSWLVDERQRTHAMGINLIRVSIAVAKWKTYQQTNRRDWSDIDLVEELRELQSFYHDNYEQERQSYLEERWRVKELTHAEARQIVQYLRQLCAPNSGHINRKTGKRRKGQPRTDATLVRVWQTYLLVKLLVYLPVRQQEIRQLKLGETLFRKIDEHDKPFYVALITDHKLKSKTRKNRCYKLPEILTQDLDEWIQVWRPKAAKAVSSLDSWLAFWGVCPDHMKEQRSLQASRSGDNSPGNNSKLYIVRRFEEQSERFQTLISTWEETNFNFERDAPLFFQLGSKRSPGKFGQPLSRASLYLRVRKAIAAATTVLFGKPRWTNPHAFRHIAAKHVRKIKGDPETLAKLMGHSTAMADTYAEQILSEYEETQDFVDHWWESD